LCPDHQGVLQSFDEDMQQLVLQAAVELLPVGWAADGYPRQAHIQILEGNLAISICIAKRVVHIKGDPIHFRPLKNCGLSGNNNPMLLSYS
jgi:hypothetical protein